MLLALWKPLKACSTPCVFSDKLSYFYKSILMMCSVAFSRRSFRLWQLLSRFYTLDVLPHNPYFREVFLFNLTLFKCIFTLGRFFEILVDISILDLRRFLLLFPSNFEIATLPLILGKNISLSSTCELLFFYTILFIASCTCSFIAFSSSSLPLNYLLVTEIYLAEEISDAIIF